MKLIKIFFILLFLQSCGGDDKKESTNTVLQGALVDSPVEGVEYQTSSQSGITQEDGSFNYLAGETVSFSLGGISLGSATAAEVLTPLHLFKQADSENSGINLVRFLLTLDTDAYSSNGISISAQQREAAASLENIDFSISSELFADSPAVISALSTLNDSKQESLSLVSADDAKQHINSSIAVLFSGIYLLTDDLNNQFTLLIQPNGTAFIYDGDGELVLSRQLTASFMSNEYLLIDAIQQDIQFQATSLTTTSLQGSFVDNAATEILFSAVKQTDTQQFINSDSLQIYVKEYSLELKGQGQEDSGQLVFEIDAQGNVSGTLLNEAGETIDVYGVVSSQNNGLSLSMVIGAERFGVQLNSSAGISGSGYGAAPQLARVNTLSLASQKLTPTAGFTIYENDTDFTISTSSGVTVESTVNATYSGTVKSFTVTVDIVHSYEGDLEVTLISPTAVQYLLHDNTGGGDDDVNIFKATQDLSSNPLVYETGIWTLRAHDSATGDGGYLDYFALEIEPDAPIVGPEISATPSSHDFGNQHINDGSATAQVIRIDNLGTTDLTIASAISITGTHASDFQITAGDTSTGVIAAGAFRDITVNFDPSAAGVRSAQLTIQSDDSDEPSLPVALTGTGDDVYLYRNDTDYGYGDFDTVDSPITTDYVGLPTTMTVSWNITNSYCCDLTVTLVHPDGSQTQQLGNWPSNAKTGTDVTVTLPYVAGEWKLRVYDGYASFPSGGTTDWWEIKLTTPAAASEPEISVNPTSMTFANQDINAAAQTQILTINNTGSADLNISSTSVSGSNYSITTGGGAQTVSAGGSHNLEVSFEPSTVGTKNATLTILSDDTDEASLPVSITGLAVATPEISLSTTSLSYMNRDINAGASANKTVTIHNTGSSALTISNIVLTAGNSHYVVNNGGPQSIAAGANHVVSVAFDPAEAGLQNGTLTITSDDADESSLDVTLSGTGTVVGDVNLPQTSLSFVAQNIADGPTASQTIQIENTGSGDLTISSLVIGDQFVITAGGGSNFIISSGASHGVDIAFDPDTAGAANQSLTINSDDADEPSVQVTLSGTGTVAPVILLDTSSLAFPDQNIAEASPATMNVLVQNTGNASLNISALSVISGASDFTITSGGGAQTILAGANQSVTVEFDPSTVGNKNGVIRILSDDAVNPSVDVSLSGTAIVEADISFDKASLSFADQNISVGPTGPETLTITNLGNDTLNLTSISLVAGITHFNIQSGDAVGVLAPGATRQVLVNFDPDAVGLQVGTLRVVSDDSDTPSQDISLSGSGIVEADINVSTLSLDIGSRDIGAGATTEQIITVSNVGNADLNITSISILSAADFTLTSTSGSQVLAQGAIHQVKIIFDPTTIGIKNETLRIISDDPDQPSIDVSLTGEGVNIPVPEIRVNPGSLSFLKQNLADGATAIQSFTITNDGNKDLNISNISLTSGTASFFMVAGAGAQVLTPSQSHQVDLVFNPSTLGNKTGNLRILSDDSDEALLDFDLIGEGTNPDVSTDTSSLDFLSQEIAIGATASQTVSITNTGTGPLTIGSIDLVSTQFNIISDTGEAVLTTGQSRLVALSFDPTSTGLKSANLTVNSDDPDQPARSVSLSGTGTAPDISVSVASLNFNSQDILQGSTANQSVTVSNDGDGRLFISSISLSGTDFNFVSGNSSVVVLPGATYVVTMNFDPNTIGNKSETLTVVSDDADENPLTVNILGQGTAAPELDLSRASLSFPNMAVSLGATAIQTVTLTNSGSAVLNISDISTGSTEFSITNAVIGTLAVGASHVINLVFNPEAEGLRSATLTIISNDVDEGVSQVTLSGTGTLVTPNISLSTSSLLFPDQDPAAGAGSALSVVISNLGDGALMINGISTTNAAFVIQSGGQNGSIAAGGTRTVQLAFDPDAYGAVAGNLTVLSDDPDQPSFNVSLGGTGKVPYTSSFSITYRDSGIGKAIEEYALSYGWNSAAEVRAFICLTCSMTDAAIEDIADNFPNLYRLQFAKGNVTTVAPLSALGGLRELSIANVDTLNMTTVSGLTTLKNLNLSSMAISDISALISLTGLANLTLNHNDIVDISALSSMVALNTLVLSDNKVISVQPLSILNNLQMLWITDNNLACSGTGSLSSLQSQLPMTFVFGDMCP